jgi:hypothetical protein
MTTLFLGDSQELEISLAWDGNDFLPGHDWGLIFTLKAAEDDADSAAKIQKTTGAGITVDDEVATVEIVPQDTTSMAAGRYVYDVQAQHVTTGEVRTVAYDKIEFLRDVTRSTQTSVPIRTTQPPYPTTAPNGVSVASPADGDMIQRVSGNWVTRTMAQIKTALGLGSAAYTDSTAYATAAQVKSSSFTAVIDSLYHAVATLTVTDPATPSEGKGFCVIVRNGTATIGGVAYSVAGTYIKRIFHSGSYATYAYKDETQFATAAQGTDSREWTATTVSQAEAEAGTATTRRAWTALSCGLSKSQRRSLR